MMILAPSTDLAAAPCSVMTPLHESFSNFDHIKLLHEPDEQPHMPERAMSLATAVSLSTRDDSVEVFEAELSTSIDDSFNCFGMMSRVSDEQPEKPQRCLSLATTATGSMSSHRERKIRFLTDEKNSIKTDYIPNLAYAHEEDQELWYTSQEMHKLQQQAMMVADFCLDCRPDYTKTALSLLSKCALSGDEDRVASDPALIEFVNGSARGLEQCVVPLLHKRRIQTVRATLQAQERLAALPTDLRWHLLAQKYCLHNRYAVRWSQMMAIGDERLR